MGHLPYRWNSIIGAGHESQLPTRDARWPLPLLPLSTSAFHGRWCQHHGRDYSCWASIIAGSWLVNEVKITMTGG
jgi:hypothetical protein